MKPGLTLAGLLFILISFSCNKETVTPDKEHLLKSKKWYETIDDSIPLMRHEYLYDNRNYLEKINIYKKNLDTAYRYQLFHYDSEGILKYSLGFSIENSSNGILIDSSCYTYEDGLLKSEKRYYLGNSPYQITYVYEYTDSKLCTKCRYDYDELLSCIKYDYEGELCIQETTYADINLSSFWNKTIHYYEDGIRIRSEVSGSQDLVYQIISYHYDAFGNLILEVSQETDVPVSAPIAYVLRYEYY